MLSRIKAMQDAIETFVQGMREIRSSSGMSEQDIGSIKERMRAMTQDAPKTYTWEEKIEDLVTLAKAAGDYVNLPINGEPGEESHYNETRRKLREAYDAFCEWRHDEPYVVDEIKAMLPVESAIVPPTVLDCPLCGYCGKMYDKRLITVGWYGRHVDGHDWIFCCEQHMTLWKYDYAAMKSRMSSQQKG